MDNNENSIQSNSSGEATHAIPVPHDEIVNLDLMKTSPSPTASFTSEDYRPKPAPIVGLEDEIKKPLKEAPTALTTRRNEVERWTLYDSIADRNTLTEFCLVLNARATWKDIVSDWGFNDVVKINNFELSAHKRGFDAAKQFLKAYRYSCHRARKLFGYVRGKLVEKDEDHLVQALDKVRVWQEEKGSNSFDPLSPQIDFVSVTIKELLRDKTETTF